MDSEHYDYTLALVASEEYISGRLSVDEIHRMASIKYIIYSILLSRLYGSSQSITEN